MRRDPPKGPSLRGGVVVVSLVSLGLLAGIFTLGFVVGKRAGRLQQERPQQALAQIDAEQKARDNLTFYKQLTSTQAPPVSESDVWIALSEGPAATGDYTVQVAAFQSQEEATAFAASLTRKGYHPFVASARVPGKGTWYRVRLGKFNSEGHAKDAKTALAAKDIVGWVIRVE